MIVITYLKSTINTQILESTIKSQHQNKCEQIIWADKRVAVSWQILLRKLCVTQLCSPGLLTLEELYKKLLLRNKFSFHLKKKFAPDLCEIFIQLPEVLIYQFSELEV